MALTLTELLAEQKTAREQLPVIAKLIDDAIDADATLNDLTSTSKTADFLEWEYVFSATSLLCQLLWDEMKSEIAVIAESAITGNDEWLQKELLKFQFGDSLSFDNDKAEYFYPLIDETKQIIKRCAVVSEGGITRIKVAKLSGTTPMPLTAPELSAFVFYKRRIQFSGNTVADPISLASDKLNAPMTVYYNGLRILADIKIIVEAAFVAYLAQLPFNGQYSVNKHGDFIEATSIDINQVDMGVVQAKPNAGVYVNVSRVYLPAAGYIEKDGTISFDTMITYVAE